jgi:hypothetical protein
VDGAAGGRVHGERPPLQHAQAPRWEPAGPVQPKVGKGRAPARPHRRARGHRVPVCFGIAKREAVQVHKRPEGGCLAPM